MTNEPVAIGAAINLIFGLRLQRADEGLAASERAMADPAGGQRRDKTDQHLQSARHSLPALQDPLFLVSPPAALFPASQCRAGKIRF